MLVALQPIEAILLRTATEHHWLVELVTLLGQPDIETGGRAGALHHKALRIVEHTLDRLGIVRIGIMVLHLEGLVIHHNTGERQKLAELRHPLSAPITIPD